jgi:mono/diheme cytochrome c family protein
VRRLVPLVAVIAVLAGCGDTVPGGGHHVTTPTPQTVIGPLPSASGPKGNPVSGKALFATNACGACHTYTPAGTNGKVGPDLDKLPQYAKQANRGSFDQFVTQSIVDPSAYIQPGYPNAMPPTYGQKLSAQQVADLVAFLTPKS